MSEKELQETIDKQGRAIAILSLRVSTLEQVLLDKGLISENDVANKAVELSKEFVKKTQEAIKKTKV